MLDLVGNALAPMIELLVLFSFFRITRSIGGFTAYQVLAMYGVSGVAFSLADLAVGNIERIRQYVRTGMFDAVLVRPLSTLGQLAALDFSFRRITRVAVALVVLAAAMSGLPIDWTLASLEESKKVLDSWYDIVGDDTQVREVSVHESIDQVISDGHQFPGRAVAFAPDGGSNRSRRCRRSRASSGWRDESVKSGSRC